MNNNGKPKLQSEMRCFKLVLFLIKFCLGLEALNTIFIHVLILKWDYSESHFLCLVV